MARTIDITPLHRAIEELEDDAMILKLYELLGIPQEAEVHQLSKEELQELQEAQAEFERGEYVTHAVAMTEARKWLEK